MLVIRNTSVAQSIMTCFTLKLLILLTNMHSGHSLSSTVTSSFTITNSNVATTPSSPLEWYPGIVHSNTQTHTVISACEPAAYTQTRSDACQCYIRWRLIYSLSWCHWYWRRWRSTWTRFQDSGHCRKPSCPAAVVVRAALMNMNDIMAILQVHIPQHVGPARPRRGQASEAASHPCCLTRENSCGVGSYP